MYLLKMVIFHSYVSLPERITLDAWIYLQTFCCWNPHVGCLWIGIFFDCNFVVSLSPCTTYLRNLRLCCSNLHVGQFNAVLAWWWHHNICISTDNNDHVTICCLNPQISPLLGQIQIPVMNSQCQTFSVSWFNPNYHSSDVALWLLFKIYPYITILYSNIRNVSHNIPE